MLSHHLRRAAAGAAGPAGTPAYWDNAVVHSNITLSESDALATSDAGAVWGSVRGVKLMSSGKFQFDFEVVARSVVQMLLGICPVEADIIQASTSLPWYYHDSGQHTTPDKTAFGYFGTGEKLHWDAGGSPYGVTFTTTDIITVYYNADAGKVWFAKNDVVQGGGDPVAGTGEAFSGIPVGQYPFMSKYNGVHSVRLLSNPADMVSTPLAGYTQGLLI